MLVNKNVIKRTVIRLTVNWNLLNIVLIFNLELHNASLLFHKFFLLIWMSKLNWNEWYPNKLSNTTNTICNICITTTTSTSTSTATVSLLHHDDSTLKPSPSSCDDFQRFWAVYVHHIQTYMWMKLRKEWKKYV